MSNTFGTLFRLTTFGESHGPAIGGIVDGMPSGIVIDMDFVQSELARRRPGGMKHTSPRQEQDEVRFLSGLYEGKTTGAPIAFMVENTDAQTADYDTMRNVFRPSHADFTYHCKYGTRDYRGGGRASARTTLSRVVAGALAKLALRQQDVEIAAYVSRIGEVSLPSGYVWQGEQVSSDTGLPCPDAETAKRMSTLLDTLRNEGDTAGGIVSCVAKGVPAGWGEPEADKLQASLAAAMMSIPAAKGFDYGDGFDAACRRGSEHNDVMLPSIAADDGISIPLLPSEGRGWDGVTVPLRFASNHDGGIQGGISNGQDICFKVAFKPIPTLMREQQTIDTEGNAVTLQPKGRHDVCAAVRAVPIVEAMAAMVLMDHWLMTRAYR